MPTTVHKTVHVAVGVIVHQQQVLIAHRLANQHQGGLWEFPGGKVETGESVTDALARELAEEVNLILAAEDFRPLLQVPFSYADKTVLLDVHQVTVSALQAKQATGLEGQEVRWVARQDLASYDFPAANVPIVQRVVSLLTQADTPHF